VLLRYGRRIGEILENDLKGQSQTLFDHLPDDEPDSLLFDARGELRGHGPRGSAAIERVLRESDLMRTIGTNVRAFLDGPESQRERGVELDGDLRILLTRLDFDGVQGSCAHSLRQGSRRRHSRPSWCA